MNLIQIENRTGKLRLNDGVNKESADKLIEELDRLYGPAAVASGMKIGDVVCSTSNALEAVEVEINSPGGGVFEGQRIYNALREMSGRGVAITTTVNGIAASMGSVILMAGDQRRMTKGSRVMIHEASSIAYGDARTMRKTANLLEGISAEIAGIYAERTGGDAAAIRNLMFEETWMTAEQAKENGFIHAIVKDGKTEAAKNSDSGHVDIRAMDLKPPSMNLLARLLPGKDEFAQIEAAAAEIDSLRADIAAKDALISGYVTDLTAKDQTIAENIATIAARDESITTLTAELQTASESLATAQADLTAKDAAIEAAKQSSGKQAIEILASIGQDKPLEEVETQVVNHLEVYNSLSGAEASAYFKKYEKEIAAAQRSSKA